MTDASYFTMIGSNMEPEEVAAMKDIARLIHKKEASWAELKEAWETREVKAEFPEIPPEKIEAAKRKEAEKKETKMEVCKKCKTAYPKGSDHTCDPERAAEVAASKADPPPHMPPDPPAGQAGSENEEGTDPEFLAMLQEKYPGKENMVNMAIEFSKNFAEHTGKDVAFIQRTATKQWDAFIGDFATWYDAKQKEARQLKAKEAKAAGKKPAGGPRKIENLDPSDYNDWKNLRNKQNYEKFCYHNRVFFKHPDNIEMYWKAKEKWSRLMPDRPFIIPQPSYTPDEEDNETEPEAVATETETDEFERFEMLLDTFPPELGTNGGAMIMNIRRVINRSKLLWPDLYEIAAESQGITIENVQAMRIPEESYNAGYELLDKIVELGIARKRNPKSLMEKQEPENDGQEPLAF